MNERKEDHIPVELARITFGLDALNEKFDQLKASNDQFHATMQKDISEMRDTANRWKGGFIVILALGGLITWFASLGASITKWWH